MIQLPKNVQNTKVKIWSDKEVEKFKEALKNHRYKCAFILGFFGLRKSEVVGLQIEDINLHKLRHICSSQMAAQKISARTIADWLGHSKFDITLDVYTHSNEETLKEALETLEGKNESKN